VAWHLQQINGGNGKAVPNEWVACPAAPTAGSARTRFVCTINNQQHFTYLDGSNNLQDCYYDGDTNQWNQTLITGSGGALPHAPAAAGPPFVCAFGNQLHFAYVDGDNNVQDCFCDVETNQWQLQQINHSKTPSVQNEWVACPDAPPVGAGLVSYGYPAFGGASLFVCTFGNQQHFTYLDGNSNLQDCFYDGDTNQWHLQQINGGKTTTVANEWVACPKAPAVGGGFNLVPSVFVCTFRNQQHFVYTDEYADLQDCYYDGDTNEWQVQQLTGEPWPSLPSPSLNPGGSELFVCAYGNQLHFVYTDERGNLQDLSYNSDTEPPEPGWKMQQIIGDVPSVANESIAYSGAPPLGSDSYWFVCAYDNQLHYVYLDDSGNVQDCFYAPGCQDPWNLQQINGPTATVFSESIACAQALPGGPPFVCTFGDQLHFTYLHTNNTLQDVFFAPPPFEPIFPVRGIAVTAAPDG
jgi:hypothetical protein